MKIRAKSPAQADPERVLLCGALALVAVLLLRNAWVCDDAFITLRTVDNFLHGHGLRWNIAERVQTYTHPLWMLLLAVASFPTRQIYLTTILVTVVVSLASMGVVACRVARTTAAGLLALAAFVLSRSFHDYCGSGLENPLTHLLLALQVVVWLRLERDARRLFHLALLAGLGMTNRLDTALLFLPAPAMALFATKASWPHRIVAGALGAVPIVAWEVFSLVYYGFPFPNTAYAKLNTHIPRGEMLRQGIMYFVDALQRDPLVLALIATGLVVGLRRGRRKLLPFVVGAALYLLYILKIGGDFMSGRFLTAPMLVAVAVLARTPFEFREVRTAGAAAFLVLLGFMAPEPTLTLQSNYDPPLERKWNDNGIADERSFYFSRANLSSMRRGNFHPDIDYVPMRTLSTYAPIVFPENIIGSFGFYSDPRVHYIDDMALADPLLSRLPPRATPDWRIGHLHRIVPVGYQDTLATGEDHFQDRGVAEYWRRLSIVVRGPIFSRERFAEIVRFNTGANDALVDMEKYRSPSPELVAAATHEDHIGWRLRLSQIEAPQSDWSETGVVGQVFVHKVGYGIRVDLEGRTAKAFELNASGNHMYRVDFLRDGEKVGEAIAPSVERQWLFTAIRRIDVPAEALAAGFDAVEIVQIHGDKAGHIAHFRIAE